MVAWRVPDPWAELAELRARGVQIEAYDAPDPKTDADGVADLGFAWAAWIVDPTQNALAIIQPKAAPAEPPSPSGWLQAVDLELVIVL